MPPVSGGATERSWYGLAKMFASRGHAVTFVSRAWPGLPAAGEEEGVTHIRVAGFDHTRHLAVNLLLDFAWGIRVSRALPPADVVICNTITLPVWLRKLVPSAGKVAVMIGRAPKGQVLFYRGVERIYAPSSSIAGQIAQPWASRRTRVIGYPIDWQLHAQSAHRGGPPLVIGYAGRLHPEKGIEILVKAAALLAGRSDLPEWKLRIVGPSAVSAGGAGESWVAALKGGAQEALGRRVEWLRPEFDPPKLARLYGGMDVFCYPSVAEKGETFGVAVAEAMAAGCAVVVSDLGCFSDLVEDGRTGLVFDHSSGSAEAILADCLGRLLADEALRSAIAARGREHARRFDYPEVARNILDDIALLTGAAAEKPQ